MKIALAPMEGVVDPVMRDILTRVGGIDYCVTEFIRVSDKLLPRRVYQRLCPELETGGLTAAGVPVVLQLLGSDPELMAVNARRAAEMGAPGIDLNFGCPAKTVNKNRGGAVLLDEPELIFRIVSAVRQAVPESVPLSAKMRLGNKDKTRALESAAAMAEAGAGLLTVHARTKIEGYRPPAHWEWVGRIREHVRVPVVANGEVWTPEDCKRCIEVSGCDDVMIGRGLISHPGLAKQIKSQDALSPCDWSDVLQLLLDYFARVESDLAPKYVHGRIKQWLHQLKRHYPEAVVLFERIKTVTWLDQLRDLLITELQAVQRESRYDDQIRCLAR